MALGVLGSRGCYVSCKGHRFGAVLILAIMASVSLWQRDLPSLRRRNLPTGWAWQGRLAYGGHFLWSCGTVMGLCSLDDACSDRLIRSTGPGLFAGEPWREYVIGLLGQALPWTPLAMAGAWRSLVRATWRGKHRVGRSMSRYRPWW